MALLRGEPTLGIKGRHRPCARSGDRLAIRVVGHVAGGEDTLDVRLGRARLRDEIARLVVVELVEEEARVRVVPDGDEEAVGGKVRDLIGVDVAEIDAGHLLLVAPDDLVDDGVRDPFDPVVRPRAVQHDLRGAEVLAPVDDRHFARELGEECRLLHRRVAAADDDDLLLAEERGVADCAVRDSLALERALGLEPELPVGRARRDDDRLREVRVVADLHAERAFREVDGCHVVGEVLGAEAPGLGAEVTHHLGPQHALGIAGVVLDIARDHQLAAERDALDDERIQVRARSVERGRVPGRPASDDDQLAHVLF